VAVAPDGTGRCVTATPAQQSAIDNILNRFGGLDNVLGTLGLPFTGVNIQGVLLAAALAVVAGLALRGRSARQRALLFTDPT
jgi:predicted outer membrane lipoprotein